MANCSKCGVEIADGVKFCPNCGNKIFETIFCPECGSQTTAEFDFCQVCGASIREEDVAVPEAPVTPVAPAQPETPVAPVAEQPEAFEQPAFETAENAEPRTFFQKLMALKKWLIPAVALLLVLVIGITTICITSSNSKRKNFIVFHRKGATYLGGGFERVKLSESEGGVTYSEDYKKIFFADDVTEGKFTLRYLNTSNPEEDYRISKDVTSYQISKNGKTVAYLKNGSLYRSDLKDSEKIKSNVKFYAISENGKRIVYLTTAGKLYVAKGDDEERISSKVENFVSASANNFSDVYYIKNDNLYMFDGRDSEKIAKGVSGVVAAYKSGELYYIKAKKDEIKLSDYVIDDLKEADEDFEMPERPQRPYSFEFDSDEEYDAAYDEYTELLEEYNEAREYYYDLQDREELREELDEETMENKVYSLYYYDGKKETELTDSYYSVSQGSDEEKVIVYYAYNQSETQKVKISEIDSVYDIKNMVQASLFSSRQAYIAMEDKVKIIDGENAVLNEDASKLYYLSDDDIYVAKISGKNLKKAERYQKNVDTFALYGDNVVAGKKDSEDDYLYDIYINKDKVASDVANILCDEDFKTFYMLADCNADKETGKLIRYKGGKTKTIDKGVHDFTVTPNGKLYYIADYEVKDREGDLFAYKMGKGKEIVHGVSEFGFVYNYQTHNAISRANLMY